MNSAKRILLATALAYAVSLPAHADCVLPPAQMRAVVDRCARELLTSYGLRSLSPNETSRC